MPLSEFDLEAIRNLLDDAEIMDTALAGDDFSPRTRVAMAHYADSCRELAAMFRHGAIRFFPATGDWWVN